MANHPGQGFLAHRPQELLEVHRSHAHGLLFGGDQNVPRIGVDGDQRTGLDVVEPPIGDQMLDELPCLGKHLDFVEDDQGPVRRERYAERRAQVQEQAVEVVAHVQQCLSELGIHPREIDQSIRIIFVPGGLLRDRGLAHTAGALDQHGCPAAVSLPREKPVVRLPPEHRHSSIARF